MGPKNQGLSTYEKEYLAIILAVAQWRSYLQYGEFVIYTDHKGLTQLNEQRLHTSWQQKVYAKLIGLQYKIIYKKGTENSAADALSRRTHHQCKLQAVSTLTPSWMEEILQGYQSDAEAQDLITQLTINPEAKPHFSLVQGILRYKGKVWLGNNIALQQKVTSALHESAIGGHSGFL